MLLRWSIPAVFLSVSVCLAAQTAAPHSVAGGSRSHRAEPHATPAQPPEISPDAELPVRRVVLYKNGVGYFEHDGRVTGNQTVTIDFTSSQLDDVLQSLTALDPAGGRIAGVDWNSTTPLDQQLNNIPLGLGDKPSAADLYAALRGARVTVAVPSLPALSGRIVDYELRPETTAPGITVSHRILTLVTDEGAVRSLEITPATSVRVLDGGLRRDLDDYLALLASTQSRQVRHLTLQAQGTGARDIRVSYISAVPVWKSTYRIVLSPTADPAGGPSTPRQALLQGWAVVDNTVGSDWINVQLSLVAGAPQSFTEPLSQPIYTERPQVPVPEAENLTPTTHESAVAGPPPVPTSTQSVMVNGATSEILAVPKVLNRNAPSPYRLYSGQNVAGGVLGALGNGSGGGYGSGSGAVQDESASASSARFDDFFEYTLAQPVTIRKNRSALVPFLQTSVPVEQVTLWNPADSVALRALWLTNASSETLDRGSFSIFENGEFAGEGLTDPIHAGEKRFLSYAADQAVHVTTEGHLDTSHLSHAAIHDGVLTEDVQEVREITYVVHNAAADPRTVIVEHPVEDGWTLNSEVKPAETSASFYRFRVATQAGETVRLHVGEAHTFATRMGLVDQPDMIQFLANGPHLKAWRDHLLPIVAAHAKVRDLETQLDANQKETDRLIADQKRLHDNLAGLRDSPEERALARRYAGEMNTDEDQLDGLKKQRAALDQQHATAQKAFSDAIASLHLDLDVQP